MKISTSYSKVTEMKILLIFAHPDDEAFSSSGTMIKAIQKGAEVSLITATLGQAGQTGELKVDSPDELGEIRKKELEAAAKIIGIQKIHFFNLMDGELYKYKIKTLSRKILPIMEQIQPDIVITFEKRGGSKHPDHIKISYAATHAFREYMPKAKKHVRLYHTVTPRSYFVQYEKLGLANSGFGMPKGVYDSHITTKIDVSNVFDQKMKALECHKSQSKDIERYKKRGEHVNLKIEFFKLIDENGIW